MSNPIIGEYKAIEMIEHVEFDFNKFYKWICA